MLQELGIFREKETKRIPHQQAYTTNNDKINYLG